MFDIMIVFKVKNKRKRDSKEGEFISAPFLIQFLKCLVGLVVVFAIHLDDLLQQRFGIVDFVFLQIGQREIPFS